MKLIHVALIVLLLMPLTSSIELYDIDIITNGSWYFNEDYKIKIHTTNIEGNLTDIDFINVTIINNINYTLQPIVRKDNGIYSQTFFINETNVASIYFNITAKEKEKIIIKTFEVDINEKPFLKKYIDKFIDYMENFKDDLSNKIENYGLGVLIFIFAGLSIFIFVDIFIRRNKK